jgi:hypothetical protein
MFLRMYFSASSMRERMSPWKSCWSMRVAVVEVAKTAQRSVRAGGLAKKRRRRLESSDSYGDVAPAACPIGNKIAGNPVVEIEDQAFIQRVGGEPAFEHLGFQSGDAVGEQRGELGVAEDA